MDNAELIDAILASDELGDLVLGDVGLAPDPLRFGYGP